MARRDTGQDVLNRFELTEAVIQFDLAVNPQERRSMAESVQPYTVGQSDTRPWGTWLVIDVGQGYIVKRITVRPGQRLSLQRHRHREEHWVIVAGTAQIVRDDESFMVEAGGVTRIPLGATHRIANPGAVDLIFIEVQLGALLAEDDIERLDDAYGRIPSRDARSANTP
jgi:mannose-1-phosphate guanylyltransferase/mannose-6-phosphate isomerase